MIGWRIFAAVLFVVTTPATAEAQLQSPPTPINLMLGRVAGSPSITLIGAPASGTGTDGNTTATVVPTLVGGGSLLVFTTFACMDVSCATAPGRTVTITDGTQTCVQPTLANTGTSSVYSTILQYCKNNTRTGTFTFTATFSGNAWYKNLQVSEWSNAHLTAPDEGVASFNTGTTGLTVTASTSSTLTAGDLIISMLNWDGGSGKTLIFNQTQVGTLRQEYQISGAPGVYANTGTISASGGAWSTVIAAFKKAP